MYKYNLRWNGILNITLNPEIWGSGNITAVPSVIIDKHLKICGTLALKVILLILRDQNLYKDTDAIKEKLRCDPYDLSDAINYWEEAGLLKLDDNAEFKKADLKPEEVKEEPKSEVKKEFIQPVTELGGRPFVLTREEVSAMIKNDKTLSQLIDEAQKIFGKTLNSHDRDTFVALYDCNNLTPHFMMMLLNFCKSVQRCTVPYLKKVAEDWISKGIDDNTVDAHVDKLLYLRTVEGRIKRALGIDRNLIKSEKENIERWVTEYKMDVDIIVKAYENCIERINKLNFNYMNKVLTSWYQNNVTTSEDLESFLSPAKKEEKKPSDETDFMKQLEENYN